MNFSLKDSKNLESQGTFSNVNYTISITAEDIEKQLRLIEADIEKMPQEQIQQMLESDSESKDSEDIDLDNNDVFGASLEDMMNLQINQGREVPVVFSWLIDMIYRTNGIRTEGIFRLPPEFTKTERLKRKVKFLSLSCSA